MDKWEDLKQYIKYLSQLAWSRIPENAAGCSNKGYSFGEIEICEKILKKASQLENYELPVQKSVKLEDWEDRRYYRANLPEIGKYAVRNNHIFHKSDGLVQCYSMTYAKMLEGIDWYPTNEWVIS